MSAAAAVLLARADRIAAATDQPGTITRLYGRAGLRRARAEVAGWMRLAGLETRIDGVGNLTGCWPGDAAGPPLVIGSHIDTVPNGGRYDGVLGVLAGLAAAERLARSGRRLACPLHVVAFVEEEGARFGTSFLGSRGWLGMADPADERLVDSNGVTLAEAVADFAGPDAGFARPPGDYLEVHIEQGPVLDAAGLPLGVVDSIIGQTRAVIRLEGAAGHAGTVPMDHRRDALGAAAEIVLEVERLARRTRGLLATVGELAVPGGVGNVVPGAAVASLDVRHADDDVRRTATETIRSVALDLAGRRRIAIEFELLSEVAATPLEPRLTDALRRAAEATTGASVPTVSSGAGHDGVIVARVAPVGMLFVRCAAGISHSPDEAVGVDDVAAALATLDLFIDGYGPTA
ncbi:MAG TPA: M20 family metallo-hydrolase [Solirubrobacteraceae bacterium]|nr:M20 family metallo-hydrolase [Solirubrobacteraceae bacterium]